MGHSGGQTLVAFENIACTGQTIESHVRSEQAISRCLCRVQLFGVCCVAQKLPKPGSLRTSATQYVDKSLFIET
ncbi:hypothetical protein D3C84_835710 [compost metagenome]